MMNGIDDVRECLRFDPETGRAKFVIWRRKGGGFEVSGERVASQNEIAEWLAHQRRNATLKRPPEPSMLDTQKLLDGFLQRVTAQAPTALRVPTEEEQKHKELSHRLWNASRAGVPVGDIEILRHPLQDRPALLAVRRWAEGGKQSLLLCGANQAGKSIAAGFWLSTQTGGLFTTASEIGLCVQPDPEQKGVQRLRQLRGALSLVIDNVGERCGQSGYEEMRSLIMHHLSQARRLIVTTHNDAGWFFRQFGDGTHNPLLARWKLVGEDEEIPPWKENPQ